MQKYITIAVALALVSSSSFAVDSSITKSATPNRIVVAKAGTGIVRFGVLSSDFPSDRSLIFATKRLTSINWETTYYPDNVEKKVEICYYRPHRHSEPDLCRPILPNSSGTVYDFNSLAFDTGASVVIRHVIEGGKNYGTAAGVDRVTINYSY